MIYETKVKCAAVIVFCFLATACTDAPVGLYAPDFGNAVQANVASETVNPNGPYDRSALTTNGERAERQQQRFLTDTVEKPVLTTTQTTGAGGGGGGGAGGGGTGGGTGGGGAGVGAGPVQ